jgi:hypothetical protein
MSCGSEEATKLLRKETSRLFLPHFSRQRLQTQYIAERQAVATSSILALRLPLRCEHEEDQPNLQLFLLLYRTA